MPTIPIMRPKLPSAERLAPYLREIDSSRIYSNFGPLALAFEERLAARFGLSGEKITTVANATLGLTLTLAAQRAPRGTLCAMPAWTFVASAHAATMAGLIPYFIDVDSSNWALDPDSIADTIASAPAAVGAVMPVVPFGQPIDVAAWDRFQSRTGLPVVIDAAAGFDAISPGAAPAVISLHATKIFGLGEGAFVMSTDSSIIRDIRTRSNFGFAGTREAAMPAANAKLSEYHAAVGLAAFDEWVDVRSEWIATAQMYRNALPESNELRFQEGFGQSWITSTCVVSFADSGAAWAENALAQAGIETRRWWGKGAHLHRATAQFPRAPVPVTEACAHSTLAIPFYRDLGSAEIGHIAEIVLGRKSAVNSRPAKYGLRPGAGATSNDLVGMDSVNTLYKVVSEVLRIPADKISSEMRIHKVDTWNSLTHIELVVTIEERFHIQLTEDEIVAMTSIGEVQRVLRDRGALS
jgi:dTDP-4-amino-4,6-dideoxygalactose transaminase/acyl carrier protein